MTDYYEFRKQLHTLFLVENCDYDDITSFDVGTTHLIGLVRVEQMNS